VGARLDTREYAPSIRLALESSDLSLAIQLHRELFPPRPAAMMHETDESDLRAYLETPLPIFSFCAGQQLHELRMRMAMAVLLRIRSDCALNPDPSFPWPYAMSPKAAAQNFFNATAVHRNVSTWLKSGFVLTAKILNSNDGPCAVCKAAAREYAVRQLPQLPLHDCENINTVGCRCSIAAMNIAGLSKVW
jgi:hypothetical protein